MFSVQLIVLLCRGGMNEGQEGAASLWTFQTVPRCKRDAASGGKTLAGVQRTLSEETQIGLFSQQPSVIVFLFRLISHFHREPRWKGERRLSCWCSSQALILEGSATEPLGFPLKLQLSEGFTVKRTSGLNSSRAGTVTDHRTPAGWRTRLNTALVHLHSNRFPVWS